MSEPWIGVDLDRTLAHYQKNGTHTIGTPVPAMLTRVLWWLSSGRTVKILTARVATTCHDREMHREMIEAWLLKHIGVVLEITSEKDFDMVELWDDLAVAVEPNTGRQLSPSSIED